MMHCCSERRMITIIWRFCLCLCLSHSIFVIANHFCLPDQKDALWDFKNEFSVHMPDSMRATEKWKNNTECCSWEGVFCDKKTGKVVELFLFNSYLNGPLRSNSSLFRLQHLQTLELSLNNLSCILPDSIGNLKYLRVLGLQDCNLFGKLPFSLGNLTYLTDLDLSINDFTSELPDSMGNLKQLRVLRLQDCNIFGKIPSSLGSLSYLTDLLIPDNDLTNEGPDLFGNLNQLTDFQRVVLNLTSLILIDLGSNHFKGMLPSNMSSLSNLESFDISGNSFSGTVPSSLFMIPSLTKLDLSRNHFSSSLEIENVTSQSNVQTLYMGENNFNGPIPRFISELVGLAELSLSYWDTGTTIVDFSIFLHLKSLMSLDLSEIHLNISSTLHLPSPMEILVLSSCKLSEFPKFLENQTSMWYLDISANQIEGQIPEWLWSLSALQYVNIAQNFFSGELTMLPNSIMTSFIASDNQLSGEIPRAICEFDHLFLLILSNNNFSGSIPRCFEMFSSSLWILHLRNNSLSGVIPEEIIKDGLISFDVGSNQLSGQLPKSLINCSNLQFLNVEDNRIKDKFPLWLSSLSNLQILVLRSNEFHGPIFSSGDSLSFSRLRIFDISENRFSGVLPLDYFVSWSVMSSVEVIVGFTPGYAVFGYARDAYRKYVVLTIKGLELALVGSDFNIYKTIDVSGNKFEGDIPESIAILKELILLNMSNNAFTGHIPPSLSNLSNLQSLDLSQNRLSGSIPPELGKLTFLARMNFSYNRLEGPIPQGTQIQSQNSSSFTENPALCGAPLLKECGEEQDEDEEKEEKNQVFSWIAAAVGYVPGLFCGLTIAYIFTS